MRKEFRGRPSNNNKKMPAELQRVHRVVLDEAATTRWIAELDVCLTDALFQSRPED